MWAENRVNVKVPLILIFFLPLKQLTGHQTMEFFEMCAALITQLARWNALVTSSNRHYCRAFNNDVTTRLTSMLSGPLYIKWARRGGGKPVYKLCDVIYECFLKRFIEKNIDCLELVFLIVLFSKIIYFVDKFEKTGWIILRFFVLDWAIRIFYCHILKRLY